MEMVGKIGIVVGIRLGLDWALVVVFFLCEGLRDMI